jgi:uncharacterized protein DUF6157
MKIHTTNYTNTFICVAEDCKKMESEVPPLKLDKPKSIARMQFEMITENPFQFTSDDIIFQIHCERKGISQTDEERKSFFSKGQPCFRSSPLAKTYGWGFHYDEQSRVALVAMNDEKYEILSNSPELAVLKAMRSSRK